MDLSLTPEQLLLSSEIASILQKHSLRASEVLDGSRQEDIWGSLEDFGALSVSPEGEGLGAVELVLIARALGRHLASVPFIEGAATRIALLASTSLPAGFGDLLTDSRSMALAIIEPDGDWSFASCSTTLSGGLLTGDKTAVDHATTVDELAVLCRSSMGIALALVPRGAVGMMMKPIPAFDPGVPIAFVSMREVPVEATAVLKVEERFVDRLVAIAAVLSAAEGVGAAERVSELAVEYSQERRQFGRQIGSFQSIQHILADMFTRTESAWSSVLYAAAALTESRPDWQQSASIAKAYASRATQEVAQSAVQVFGGIAFTAEHPAHLYLRRIVVRGQRFGDALHHERLLGHSLVKPASA